MNENFLQQSSLQEHHFKGLSDHLKGVELETLRMVANLRNGWYIQKEINAYRNK